MKALFFGSALLFSLITTQVVHAQSDTAKDRRAYADRVQSVFKANAPAMTQFAQLLSIEVGLQKQLRARTITPKQYEVRSPKPAVWRSVIPQMRSLAHKFPAIKPVPPSMASVNKGLTAFSSSMDKSLNKLDHWTRTRKSADFNDALVDVFASYQVFMTTAKTAKEKMGGALKPR